MKDRLFFICLSVTGMQVTVVVRSGLDQVMRRFHLGLPGV